MPASPFKNLDEFVEVPKLFVATSLEAFPNLYSDCSVVVKDCAGVIEFVRTVQNGGSWKSDVGSAPPRDGGPDRRGASVC
jgi:hypothetical protein